jgi:hypothetical protein
MPSESNVDIWGGAEEIAVEVNSPDLRLGIPEI